MATAFKRVDSAIRKITTAKSISIEGKVAVNRLHKHQTLQQTTTTKNYSSGSIKAPNPTPTIFKPSPKLLSTSTISSSTNFYGKPNILVSSSFSTFAQSIESAQLPAIPSEQATNKKQVTRADIMAIEKYTQLRPGYYKLRKHIKENRRLEIGPYSSVTFMNYDIVWLQVHEMLWIEKGGEKQIDEELAAYNPLIPQGSNLVFTFMLEYPDAKKRPEFLRKLGHVEETVILSFGQHKLLAVSANDEIKRTTDDGKTSALHFLRFNFNPKQIEDFKKTTDPVVFEINHKNYSHSTKLQQNILDSVRKDLEL